MDDAVTHDVITVALPFLVILAGTFFNNRAIAKVDADVKAFRDETRAEIKDLRATMEKRFDRVDDHLTRLHSITGVNTRADFRRSSASGRAPT